MNRIEILVSTNTQIVNNSHYRGELIIKTFSYIVVVTQSYIAQLKLI